LWISDNRAVTKTATYPTVVRPRRRWWRILRNLIALAALAAAGVWAVQFQQAYATWPGMDVGNRINWCGKVYRVAVTDLTWAEVNDGSGSVVQPLFEYPPHIPRREVYGLEPAGSIPCPVELFIHTGADRYTKYLAGAS
jgi:hypothetical protein